MYHTRPQRLRDLPLAQRRRTIRATIRIGETPRRREWLRQTWNASSTAMATSWRTSPASFRTCRTSTRARVSARRGRSVTPSRPSTTCTPRTATSRLPARSPTWGRTVGWSSSTRSAWTPRCSTRPAALASGRSSAATGPSCSHRRTTTGSTTTTSPAATASRRWACCRCRSLPQRSRSCSASCRTSGSWERCCRPPARSSRTWATANSGRSTLRLSGLAALWVSTAARTRAS